MPAHLKSELFSRIQKEKNWIEISAKIPSRMFFFSSRRIMYTSLAAVLIFVVFGWILLDKTEVVDFWIFSVKQNVTPNWVFADYVAEIVEFNWEYSLARDWKVVINSDELNTIQDWDVVSLPEWTDLIFNLQDWTQAKIIWPAEFSISKTAEWYQISLFDGKFFRIYCPECSSDVEIITPDFSISQEKDQTLDLHIAKEDNWEMLVKNDWDNVTVKTKKSESESEIKQISSELVAISSDSNIDIVEDSDVMLSFMAKNNISATFTLSSEQVDWPKIKPNGSGKFIAMQTKSNNDVQNNDVQNLQPSPDENVQTISESKQDEVVDPLLEWLKEIIVSDNKVSWEINEEAVLELWLSSVWQQVPSESQMQNLKTNLNSFFLMNIFESIYSEDKVNQNISRLADRINSIASNFWYSDRASSDLLNIKNTALTLKNKLEKDWYIPSTYILQMEKLSNWCDELNNPSQSDWESLKSDLPTELRLVDFR